jgi:RNA polymerase sigma-70 factor (ECF subfamily)
VVVIVDRTYMAQSDQELIAEIQSGKTANFRILVERHKDRAFTLAVRLLKQRNDAEEALQDAFLRAYKALEDFRGDAKFSTWFYRIVYNICLTRLARMKPEADQHSYQTDEEERYLFQVASVDALPDEILEQNEFMTVIAREIERMPEHYRVILTLYYINEMTYEEMSDILQLPLGTIKTHLFRGRAFLRSTVIRKYYAEEKTV